MDIKPIDFETRVALENITKIRRDVDGSLTVIDAPLAVWQYVSAAKFGVLMDKLTKEQKAELMSLSKDEAADIGAKAREHYENPGRG